MPTRLVIVAVAVLSLAAASVALVERGAAAPPVDVAPEYLALGDSLATGIGASGTASAGYVPLVYGHLQRALDPGHADPPALDYVPDALHARFLGMEDFGVGGPAAPAGGETSGTMIAGGQLAAALAELTARNGDARPVNDVEVITLSIGGNDMFTAVPVCLGGFSPACSAAVTTALTSFGGNFNSILSQLRAAAGPDTAIVVQTYFNALTNPGCPLSPFAALGAAVLEGDPALGLAFGLNDVIRATATAHGAAVAETFGAIGPADVHPDCRHPNDGGHAKIATAFIEALES